MTTPALNLGEKYVFPTALGELWLWGEPGALSDPRPVVLCLNGAFSIERPRPFELQALVPDAVVLNAHLPGNHCPPTAAASVGVYAAAYSQALDAIGRPAIVVGASVGALVAMAMRSPAIRALVLIEPPLQTGKLWPLTQDFRGKLASAPDHAELAAFLWAVFGVSGEAHENRDYRHLIDGLKHPGWVLLGGLPLMPERPLAGELPSLVDAPERALLAAQPQLQTRVVAPVGHNVGGRAIGVVAQCVQDLLDCHVEAAQPLAPAARAV